MKKLIAICILLVHLYNLVGYRVVVDSFETRLEHRMQARLDQSQYAEKDLIELRVPVNLPYHNNWSDFERYDGEIVIGGIHYNYVKRKLLNDTLILLAIPNPDKMKLFNARETFFSLVNDLQGHQDQTPGPVKTIKLFHFDYAPEAGDIRLTMPQVISVLPASGQMQFWPENHLSVPVQPPEARV